MMVCSLGRGSICENAVRNCDNCFRSSGASSNPSSTSLAGGSAGCCNCGRFPDGLRTPYISESLPTAS